MSGGGEAEGELHGMNSERWVFIMKLAGHTGPTGVGGDAAVGVTVGSYRTTT